MKEKNKKFNCCIFIDDGNEYDTIIEGVIEAKNEQWAVSELLSREARKRNIAYYWLKEKVIDSLVELNEN